MSFSKRLIIIILIANNFAEHLLHAGHYSKLHEYVCFNPPNPIFTDVETEAETLIMCPRPSDQKITEPGIKRKQYDSTAVFLNFRTTDTVGQKLAQRWGLYCALFEQHLGPLCIRCKKHRPSCDNENCLQTLLNVPRSNITLG